MTVVNASTNNKIPDIVNSTKATGLNNSSDIMIKEMLVKMTNG